MPSRNSSAAWASPSSILDSANPTWIRTQSPGTTTSSSSSPMLIARRTPLTLTLARSGRSSRISMTSPGIPRHMGTPLRAGASRPVRPAGRQLDALQQQLVAAGLVQLGRAAGRAGDQQLAGLALGAAGSAGDPDREDDQVELGPLGLRPGRDQLERLLHGGPDGPVQHPDPDPDPRHRPPGGPAQGRV